jgi:maltooligosyltrehalose trehalohydrolase
MLFQGEEWGASSPFLYFTDHKDPELAQAVREGRRDEFAAFGWEPAAIPDPQAEETFMRSKLDWEEPEREPHAELLQWHRSLIRLRRESPSLGDGRMEAVQVRCDEGASWLTVERGALSVVCNLSDSPQTVPLAAAADGGPAGRGILLASEEGTDMIDQRVCIPGEAVAIVGPV